MLRECFNLAPPLVVLDLVSLNPRILEKGEWVFISFEGILVNRLYIHQCNSDH